MSDRLLERALDLRRAFDASFAAPVAAAPEVHEDLLFVRVATEPYAVRLADLQGVVSNRRIVAAPARATAFLGLAGIRGAPVPVFGLAALLGHPPEPSTDWLLMCRSTDPLALAFSALDGLRRVASSAVRPAERPDLFVSEVVLEGARGRPIVALARLVASLETHVPAKEQ